MNRDYQAKGAIADQAAEWLERLPMADAYEGELFLQWFRQSPVHAREFFLAVRAAERLKHLDPQRLLNVQEFIDAARQGTTQLAQPVQSEALQHMGRIRPRRTVRPGNVAAVMGLAALLIVVTVTLHAVSSNSVSTDAGESQTVHLADGSVLRVGSRTNATIAFTDHERVIRLLQGELMAYVAKDSSRPFYVVTELATTRAVGTAFAVRRYKDEPVVVTVQEGSVRVRRAPRLEGLDQHRSVASTVVSAGEQARVTAEAGSIETRPVDLGKELAWVTGKLRFTTETLGQAIREFNLRNKTQITLLSPQAEGRAIRGAFDFNDPRNFASSVAASVNLTLVEDHGGTLLLVPNVASTPSTSSELENP